MHRPRHSARQRTALGCAVAFFLAPMLAFVFGVHPAEIENRPLSGLHGTIGSWACLGCAAIDTLLDDAPAPPGTSSRASTAVAISASTGRFFNLVMST